MRSRQLGQALLEWCIFGAIAFGFTFGSYKLARVALNRTVVETWSVLSSRQKLSRAQEALPTGVQAIAQVNPRQASVLVIQDQIRSRFWIRVPEKLKANEALFSWRSLSSGYHWF